MININLNDDDLTVRCPITRKDNYDGDNNSRILRATREGWDVTRATGNRGESFVEKVCDVTRVYGEPVVIAESWSSICC